MAPAPTTTRTPFGAGRQPSGYETAARARKAASLALAASTVPMTADQLATAGPVQIARLARLADVRWPSDETIAMAVSIMRGNEARTGRAS